MTDSTSGTGRLQDRIALITGGTSGIGKATALAMSQEGAVVILTGRREELGTAVVADIASKGGQAAFIQADHTHAEECGRVVEQIINDWERLDILFNNAGIVVDGTAETTTEQGWHDTLLLNVTAVWRMSRFVLPHMRRQGGGVIVNNASDWGLVGGRNAVAYCASKGAVVQMTRAMALDHARENIRINAVCPGDTFVERWVQDGYLRGSGPLVDLKDQLAADGAALPMGRIGQAEEVARVVVFLASDDSSYITGALLPVDGGNTAR